MSSKREARFYYLVTFIIGTGIIYSSITSLFLNTSFNMTPAIISIIFATIVQVMEEHGVNKFFRILLLYVMLFVIEAIFLSFKEAMTVSIYVLISNWVLTSRYGQEIDYNLYRHDIVAITMAMMCSIGIGCFLGIEYKDSQIIRTILVYSIAALISLRSSMQYYYRIKNEREKIMLPFLAVGFFILLCSNVIFNILVYVGRGVVSVFIFMADKVLTALVYICFPIFNALYEFIKGLATGESTEIDMTINNSLSQQIMEEGSNGNEAIFRVGKYIIAFLLVVIIAIVIYKFIKGIIGIRISKDSDSEYEEEVEKINYVSSNRKRKYRSLGNRSKEARAIIIYNYNRLIKTYAKEGIFKPYMTPTQFGNNLKLKHDDSVDIKDLNGVYNKAKFSNHHITDEEVKLSKSETDKILKKSVLTIFQNHKLFK